MRILRATFLPVLFLLHFCVAVSHGQTMLVAQLSNDNEPGGVTPTLSNGDPRPASFGTATFLLNAAMTSMTMHAEIFNLDFTGSQTTDVNDNLAAAHIHAGPTVTPTTNGGVVWGFFGAPFNDNNPNDQVVTPFASGVGGTIDGKWDAPEGNNTTLADQLTHILNERSYVNFHSAQFSGGEVRGTLVIVPEPGAIALSLIGMIGCLTRRRGR